MPADHIENTIEFADGRLVPRDAKLRIECVPLLLAEIEHLDCVYISQFLRFLLEEQIYLRIDKDTTGCDSKPISRVTRIYIDARKVEGARLLHALLANIALRLDTENVTVGIDLVCELVATHQVEWVF